MSMQELHERVDSLLDTLQMKFEALQARLATVEAEWDAARAKRDAALAEVAHMKREQQAMIMQHRHDIRDLGQLLQDERCKVATIEAAWYAAQAGQARAVEALRDVLIGLREDLKDRNPEDYARHGLVEPGYCEALQDVTDGLEEVLYSLGQPALDWLAQQRREAAAEALEEFAYDADAIEELITCNIFDLRSAFATRAAALRAGEVGND